MDQCESEKLHLSGKIQPFGAFMRIDAKTLTVTHVSRNIELYCHQTAEDVLGKPVTWLEWLPSAVLADLDYVPGSRLLDLNTNSAGELLHFRVIRANDAINVEMEHRDRDADLNRFGYRDAISYQSLKGNWDEQDYFEYMPAVLNRNLPFERVLLYRFEDDWTGEVVAESSKDGTQRYRGLKFPASDIPAIARRLYFLNPSRVIPDATAEAVDIIGISPTPPDLTYSDLRSISPIHIDYLKNMQVQASYSIPVILSGVLWGLISCHHPSPLKLDVMMRLETERLVESFSNSYGGFVAGQHLKWLKIAEDNVHRFSTSLASTNNENRLSVLADTLCSMFSCDGVVVFHGHELAFNGPPDWRDLLMDMKAAADSHGLDKVTAVADFREYLGDEHRDFPVRGVLIIRESFDNKGISMFILRKPEIVHNQWAGNPDKTSLKENAEGRLMPRDSFERWSETNGECGARWEMLDMLMAKKIRAVMLGVKKAAR